MHVRNAWCLYLAEECVLLYVDLVGRQQRRRQHRVGRRGIVQVAVAVCLDSLQLLLLLLGQERVEPVGNVLVHVHLTVQLLRVALLLLLRRQRMLLLLLQLLLRKRLHRVRVQNGYVEVAEVEGGEDVGHGGRGGRGGGGGGRR